MPALIYVTEFHANPYALPFIRTRPDNSASDTESFTACVLLRFAVFSEPALAYFVQEPPNHLLFLQSW